MYLKVPHFHLRLVDFLKHEWLLLVFIALKLIIQFVVVHPEYELHRDEFLYLDQAKHLAFGFISVPPLTAVFSYFIFALGGSEFWIRFFPALFGALTLVFTWLIVHELGGKIYSKVLVMCAFLFSVYVRLNILFQPNAFDVLAWTAAFYFFIKYIHTSNIKWLLYFALSIALGIYNKYTVIFLLIGFFIGIILTSHRAILLQKKLYVYLLFGLVIISPNICWQITNHFPVLHHMQALKTTQLDNTNAIGFLKEQILFMNGSLPVFLFGLLGLFFYKKMKPFQIIGITYIVVLLILITLKAKGYYALGLYPVILAFGGIVIESIFRNAMKKWVVVSFIVLNLLVFVYTFDVVMPIKTPQEIIDNQEKFEQFGLLKWNDGKNHHIPQDFADMLGWKEMAAKTLRAYETIPENEKQYTLIFCDNYGQTGALNYYNRNKTPEAYSANTDYIYWIPKLDTIKHIILVGEKPDSTKLNMFETFESFDIIENQYAIEKNTGIFILRNSHIDFTPMFYKYMQHRKQTFDIF